MSTVSQSLYKMHLNPIVLQATRLTPLCPQASGLHCSLSSVSPWVSLNWTAFWDALTPQCLGRGGQQSPPFFECHFLLHGSLFQGRKEKNWPPRRWLSFVFSHSCLNTLCWLIFGSKDGKWRPYICSPSETELSQVNPWLQVMNRLSKGH